jgi:tripartite ATP-independent transporter DctM subunit
VTIRDGILSIFAAVIIVGGIVFGIFTATEASAVAVLYSLFLTLVIYREMKVKDLWPVCKTVVKTTTAIMLLIGCASAFGWVMSVYQIPVTIAGFFLTITHNRYLLLLLINMLLLVLGCIMDMAPLLLIMAPVLYPIVCVTLGMSPIQFGILLMCNLSIGLTAPPVGSALFVGSTVANIPLEKTARAMLNFWPAMLLVTLIVTYVPWVTMYLPGLFK